MVRLRDLGGGEPNDDLTWALFEERRKSSQVGHPARRASDVVDPPEDEVERSTTPKASKGGSRRGGAGRRKS